MPNHAVHLKAWFTEDVACGMYSRFRLFKRTKCISQEIIQSYRALFVSRFHKSFCTSPFFNGETSKCTRELYIFKVIGRKFRKLYILEQGPTKLFQHVRQLEAAYTLEDDTLYVNLLFRLGISDIFSICKRECKYYRGRKKTSCRGHIEIGCSWFKCKRCAASL